MCLCHCSQDWFTYSLWVLGRYYLVLPFLILFSFPLPFYYNFSFFTLHIIPANPASLKADLHFGQLPLLELPACPCVVPPILYPLGSIHLVLVPSHYQIPSQSDFPTPLFNPYHLSTIKSPCRCKRFCSSLMTTTWNSSLVSTTRLPV